MPSQWRPAFNRIQEQAGIIGSVGVKSGVRYAPLWSFHCYLLLIPHPWSLIALVWIGALFRFIATGSSWNRNIQQDTSVLGRRMRVRYRVALGSECLPP